MPRPSIGGGDSPDFRVRPLERQGCRLISSAKLTGRWLKTGLGAFSRRMITPSMRLKVSPTMSRKPSERQKSPSTPRIGIDNPTKAKIVRIGRVNKFLQAKRPITDESQSKDDEPPSWRPVRLIGIAGS